MRTPRESERWTYSTIKIPSNSILGIKWKEFLGRMRIYLFMFIEKSKLGIVSQINSVEKECELTFSFKESCGSGEMEEEVVRRSHWVSLDGVGYLSSPSFPRLLFSQVVSSWRSSEWRKWGGWWWNYKNSVKGGRDSLQINRNWGMVLRFVFFFLEPKGSGRPLTLPLKGGERDSGRN